MPSYRDKKFRPFVPSGDKSIGTKRAVKNAIDEALAQMPFYDIFMERGESLQLGDAGNFNIYCNGDCRLKLRDGLINLHIYQQEEGKLLLNLEGELFISLSLFLDKNSQVITHINGKIEMYEYLRNLEEAKIYIRGKSMGEIHSKLDSKAPLHYSARYLPQGDLSHRLTLKAEGTAKVEMRALLTSKVNVELLPGVETSSDGEVMHAASISNIDEEELFYLRARGIEKSKAEELLKEAFLKGGKV